MKISGEDAAEMVGYEGENRRKTASAWETGRGSPDLATFRALCRLYGCTADSVLWGEDEAAESWPPQDLLRRLMSVGEDKRAPFAELLKAQLNFAGAPEAPKVLPGKHKGIG